MLPLSCVCSTVSGVPIEPSTGLAKPSPAMARSAKATTWRRAGRSGEPRGSAAIAPWTMARELRRPRSWKFSPARLIVPPFSTCCKIVDGDPEHLLGDRLLDLVQPGADRLLDELAIERVLGVEDQLDRRAADAAGDQALDLGDEVGGDDQRGQRLAVLTLAIASWRELTLIGWMD